MKKQLETLTIENIKPYAMTVRQKDYPEYGNWGITKDGEFYGVRNDRGSRVLFESEFNLWEIVSK